jgi:hypothetical protein
MADESVHKNPRDPEAQVVDINCNMNLLIESIAIKIIPFEYDGGSNSEIKLKRKLGD